MIVIVRDIVNDTERAYHGSEQVVENALRVAYPFLTACVQLGDMDTLLYEIGRSYGKLVEVPEGQALDPLMHLPMRFDCEPHECKTGCPLFNGISKREQWLNELDAYVLEKSVFDLKPGEETQPIQEDPDSHHSAVFYDYSHLLHPGVINKPGHRYHGQRYGDVFRVHLFERPNPSGNGWYLRAKLLEHPFDKYNEVGYVSGIQYPKRKGVPEKHLNVGMAEINHEHRGLGLGAALYESFYAHGAHYHGATHIAGGVHSTMAHKTHQRLSDKHGLEYYAQPNEGSTEARDFGQGEFDSAYGPYEYTIKAESPFTEAAFRNKHSGEVCGTQFFHNIDLIPPSWGVDEDHVEHIEAGFLDHTGRFYTRQEAADRLKQAAPLQSEDLRQQGLGRPEGHEHLGGGAGMVKMAIADIRPGTERPSSDTTLKNYDYSHVLSPLFKRSYRISIRERVNTNPKFYSVVMQAKNKKPTAKWDGHIFASVHDNNGPKHVIVEDSFLHPDHRGKGLGLALYEAALAHAKHVHEVAEVRGGYHSTSAHNVHKRLSEKHGMRYEAPTTAGDMYDPDDYFKSPPRAYDAKYGHYKYTLKSEDDSLFALANNLNTAGDTVEEAGRLLAKWRDLHHESMERLTPPASWWAEKACLSTRSVVRCG
jgi:GNAT superfamily N-acetyltransferase/predicted RNase H-like HicB family nuclease